MTVLLVCKTRNGHGRAQIPCRGRVFSGDGYLAASKPFNGASDLITQINVFVTPQLLAEKDFVGIIVDADANPSARRQSVGHILGDVCGVAISHGEWVQCPKYRAKVGYFIVPDGSRPGEIETLVWEAWSNDVQNAPTRQCIDSFISCMASLGITARSPDKGKIGALLAIRNDDDPRLGPGAQAGVFSFDRHEFAPLLDFLGQL